MLKARRILVPILSLAAAAAISITAGVIGAYFYVFPGLPPAETIRDIPLQIPLRVFSRDGKLISEIGEKRRIPVAYADIPPVVEHALLAAEDDRFYSHPGVDYQGILRAMWVVASTGSKSQGGSTLTQQLARDYFLNRDRLLSRKLLEAFLAYRIEKEFSKQDILTMFFNKMFFGQRAYGIAAAARVYFDKPLDQLNAAEAATLVGVLTAPSRKNPVSSPEQSMVRRSYVLGRMRELNYLDETEYREAMDYPMESTLHGPDVELNAPYVAEMVRQFMLDREEYKDNLYVGGYEVFTTLDSQLQVAAVDALRNGLLEYDRRHGYRGVLGKIDPDIAATAESETFPIVRQALREHPEHAGLRTGLVKALNEDQSATVVLRNDDIINVPWSGISWARTYIDIDHREPEPETVDEVLSVGDVIYVIPTVDESWALAQIPDVQGAFVALDPNDGAVAALQGGFAYSLSKYNRARQIRRQPGSTFKPFNYSAALESGMTAGTVINDAPVVLEEDAELEQDYRPKNYGGRFHGPTRLREALYRSFNLVSVRVLLEMGISHAVKHLEKFGFTGDMAPANTSLALGSGAMSPLQLATGYSVFANAGYKVEPYFVDRIVDSDGQLLYQSTPAIVCDTCLPREADDDDAGGTKSVEPPVPPAYSNADDMIDRADRYRPSSDEAPELFAPFEFAPRVLEIRNAFIMSDIMRDVIRRGTGVRARALGRDDLSGKTGTSNDRRDAWFAGFNADLVATTWVGFNEDQPLGAGEEGSRTALPIWVQFMEVAMDGVEEHQQPEPEGITTVRISPETGELAGPGDRSAIFEKFRDEYAPKRGFNNRFNNFDEPFRDPFNDSQPFNEGEEGATEEPLF